jgi:hypothetical protein
VEDVDGLFKTVGVEGRGGHKCLKTGWKRDPVRGYRISTRCATVVAYCRLWVPIRVAY